MIKTLLTPFYNYLIAGLGGVALMATLAAGIQTYRLKHIDAKHALAINKLSADWQTAVDAWQNTYREADAYAKAQQLQRYEDITDWQHRYNKLQVKNAQEQASYEQIIKRNQGRAGEYSSRLNEQLHKIVKRVKAQDAAIANTKQKCMPADTTAPSHTPRPNRLRPTSEVFKTTAAILAETGAFAEEVSPKYNALKSAYVACLNAWPSNTPDALSIALATGEQDE